jgi:hypothetical protein
MPSGIDADAILSTKRVKVAKNFREIDEYAAFDSRPSEQKRKRATGPKKFKMKKLITKPLKPFLLPQMTVASAPTLIKDYTIITNTPDKLVLKITRKIQQQLPPPILYDLLLPLFI